MSCRRRLWALAELDALRSRYPLCMPSALDLHLSSAIVTAYPLSITAEQITDEAGAGT